MPAYEGKLRLMSTKKGLIENKLDRNKYKWNDNKKRDIIPLSF